MPEEMLAAIPLFKDLSAPERSELAGMMRPRTYAKLQPVFWVGEKGDEFYLISNGQLSVTCPDENGKDVKLATLEAGNFFGELSLLDGGPRTATVRADVESSLLALGREDFLQFLMKHPDAAIRMLTILGQRQRETLEKVRGIRNVNEAVAASTTHWNRVAERTAEVIASRIFLTLNLLAFALWIVVNLLLDHWHRPGFGPFDDPPHFSVLSFIVTVEALLITLFVLISQGLQQERDRIRADLDYQVNVKAHQELMQLQQKMDRLAAMLSDRHGKAGQG
jgi:CRP/FNR family cyclic AMP-dependent transcriptional regulator